MSTNEKTSLLSLNDFISGSLAGIVQVLVGQPFDMMKVRMQTKPKKYFGLYQTLKKIIFEESPLAFYKGTFSPLIGISFTVAIQFSSNTLARNYFSLQNAKNKNNKTPEILSIKQNLLSGVFAGFCSSFMISPIELIRIKLQVQGNSTTNKYNGTVDCATQIYRYDGFKGIYQGFCSSLLRECPAFAFYFGVYETLMQKSIIKYGKKSDVPLGYSILYGAVSGIMLWTITFPFDVIKSRIQADDPANRKYKNIMSTFHIIHRDSGIGGFFKGIVPCLVRAPIGNGLTFLTFEYVSKKLKSRKN